MALENLKDYARSVGRPEWRAMLAYVAELHARSVRPAQPPFPFDWEEIGPGYCYGPAFGHWDLIHALFDSLPAEPEHVGRQIRNYLAPQEEDGLIPGSIWMREGGPRWSRRAGHPPVWPVIVEALADLQGGDLLVPCLRALVRQIRWFETHRKAEGTGFFYTDILTREWESGIDEGVRYLDAQPGPRACVDATAHAYLMYDHAARWSERFGQGGAEFADKLAALGEFMREALFVEETGMFHDSWSAGDARLQRRTFEGMWPMVVGAATPGQARAVIEQNLLNPERFFTRHPIATVSPDDPAFELRMWRGPAWNSMTFWAARGCARYGFRVAAVRLLEAALTESARQFERTGTVWEFYHPHGGRPEDVRRKPATKYNQPCRDYLGHNPLIAMAALHDAMRDGGPGASATGAERPREDPHHKGLGLTT